MVLVLYICEVESVHQYSDRDLSFKKCLRPWSHRAKLSMRLISLFGEGFVFWFKVLHIESESYIEGIVMC